MRAAVLTLTFLAGLIVSSSGFLMQLPARLSGIVYVDRWGGCYFFTGGNNIFDVSAKNRDTIQVYSNKFVKLQVTKTYFVVNPGDIRLDDFTYEGPGEVGDLQKDELLMVASQAASDKEALSVKLSVTNTTDRSLLLTTKSFRLIVLTKKPLQTELPPYFKLHSVSDGPSFAFISGAALATTGNSAPGPKPLVTSACGTQTISWRILSCEPRPTPDHTEVALLPPHQILEIVIECKASRGEYEILFGYEGSYKRKKPALSNAISVDVTANAH